MNRNLIFLTLAFLLVSMGFLAHKQVTTGFFIEKGVELKGGDLITISFDGASSSEISEMADVLRRDYGVSAYPVSSIVGVRLSIEAPQGASEEIVRVVEAALPVSDYEVSQIDPKLSSSILSEITRGIIFAFVAMAIIIFLLFRSVVPSFAVVLAAFSDIVGAVFLMNLIGIELTLATFIGLLMILGYSVDTNILLTNRTLREKGHFKEQYKSALRTGLTMTATSVVALLSIMLVAGYGSVFGQLVAVLLLGLLLDLPNTWIQNAIILEYFKDKYHK
jgi:preprotein translocase subunit SecF